MAKSQKNVVTYGLSGKIGDLLVFRQVNGKTIVSKMPQAPTNASEKQKGQQQHFQQATIYAKTALGDPSIKERYEAAAKKKKGRAAYHIAVVDFFNAPTFTLSICQATRALRATPFA
jgi:hypothetical protein